MTDQHTSRRAVLHGGAALGLTTLVVGSVRLASAAVAGVPTPSSRAALAASTSCATLTKEETQGPFWVDEKLNRSDVRTDTATGTVYGGVPLTLTMLLQDAGAACAPQAGAYVDIWHTNAQGAYSDVSGSGNPNEVGHDFLRGYQVSDDDGKVTFTTIWPGWYSGRTIHVHFRIRLSLDSSTTVNFTSQIFFDESVNNAVLATSAYQKSGTRDTTNAKDDIYDASLLMPVTGSTTAGYAGTFTVNLDFGDGDATSTATATASPTDTATATATATASPTATATTTTATPGPTATPTPDSVVDARVISADVVRRGRKRLVKVVVHGDEKYVVRANLQRHDDLLARRTTGWLVGRHTITCTVPRGVDAGAAKVVVGFADKAGNTKITTKRVTIPARHR